MCKQVFFNIVQVDYYVICVTPEHFHYIPTARELYPVVHLDQHQQTATPSISDVTSGSQATRDQTERHHRDSRAKVRRQLQRQIIAVVFHGKPKQLTKSLYQLSAHRLVSRIVKRAFLYPTDYKNLFYYLSKPERHLQCKVSRIKRTAVQQREVCHGHQAATQRLPNKTSTQTIPQETVSVGVPAQTSPTPMAIATQNDVTTYAGAAGGISAHAQHYTVK